MSLGWFDTSEIEHMEWVCGYCGKDVAGNVGYRLDDDIGDKYVYICPNCENPTAFIYGDNGEVRQIPSPVCGNDVDCLPESVGEIYGEVRRCIQCSAFTAAVLLMRKLLMHVAVEQGADEGQSFVSYVDYLDSHHWIPPTARQWVDAIRKYGNDVNHEITVSTEEQAKQLLDFTEMLLKLVYEFPSKLKQ